MLGLLSGHAVDSLGQATLALAKLVGFAPSPKQPLPGVKVLANAIERFFFFRQGAQGYVQTPTELGWERGLG